MNGTKPMEIPKFLEGESLPAGYYDEPNPYVSAPSCNIDLPALSKYARSIDKSITDLTKEEVRRFAMK